MCAYSSVNRSSGGKAGGLPNAPDCANGALLQDALREKMGFKGMVRANFNLRKCIGVQGHGEGQLQRAKRCGIQGHEIVSAFIVLV